MSENVRQRALGAILMNAVVSWQTLVTLLVTAILFLFFPAPFPWWQAWFWLAGGVIAEAGFVISALTDPQAAQQAVARQFASQYDLAEIKNPVSRGRLRDALEYRRNMLNLARQQKGAMRVSLEQTVNEVNAWIGHMYELSKHIDAFESNDLVERDVKMVPQQLEKAKVRLNQETDPAVQRDLQNQIKQLEQQKANLEATVNSIKRAEIQLESTLSSLGTIYAQMSLMGTKEVDSASAQRMRLEIQDQVSGLQDTISAMDEVQAQRLRFER